MSAPTLQQIIEEYDAKTVSCRIIIAGAPLNTWTSLDFEFSIGQQPVARIVVPGKNNLPASVAEEAAVEIWFGYRTGVTVEERLVFGGALVDSVGNNGTDFIIECAMDGPRKLSYTYNRMINYDFTAVIAEDTVIDLLQLAGVANYSVNLVPWVIGTAVPQTIQFSTYGEAINKIAEVDGTPWYAMPTGQVRVETRDPLPSPTARRTYFTGVLTGSIESQPVGISNSAARPRINDLQRRKLRSEVANFIEVDGAVVTTLGPNGEQNSEQITETVDGLSGTFPNGAPWIPTPPLFQHFVFQNELIDTNAKAFEVGERYFDLKNRLIEEFSLTVPGDPDVFLGSTVKVVDRSYSGVVELYFVRGYRTHIDSNSCITELSLIGGEGAGTTGFASPFAEFMWTYQSIHNLIGGNPYSWGFLDLGPGATIGSELCMDLPAGMGPIGLGGGVGPGEDKPVVYIGFDGTHSQDFDGQIVSWEWSDTEGHTGSGPRLTIAYDPALVNSVEMTLTVTDDSGRTDAITKTVYTSSDYLEVPGSVDSTINDTPQGGGVVVGNCSDPEEEDPGDENEIPSELAGPGGCNGLEMALFVAAGAYAMGTLDNRTWNDLTPAAAGAGGSVICVGCASNVAIQESIALFGTSTGDIFRTTDYCQTGALVLATGSQINCICFESSSLGIPHQGDAYDGAIPSYTEGSPGTLSMQEAYHLALQAGFSPTIAVIVVAILMAESGLQSNATNTAGNNPPSTDRGIAQINDYYHPEVSDACAFNPACALREMHRISGGGDFSQWAAYTAGTYRQYLSQVQEAVGIEGPIGDEESGFSGDTVHSLKVWAGTESGEIYLSRDSGLTWELWGTISGPVKVIITSPALKYPSDEVPPLAVFGGDTSDIFSLISIAANSEGGFEPLNLSSELRAQIAAAGAGHYIRAAVLGSVLMIIFSGGLDDLIWFSADPINNPESWYPAIDDSIPDPYSSGIDIQVRTGARGFSGEFVVAGADGISKTEDDESFTVLNTAPSTINHLFWLGLPGMYLAAATEGLYITMDYGQSVGFLRPNSTFGNAWPGGADAKQVAVAIGPRPCETYQVWFGNNMHGSLTLSLTKFAVPTGGSPLFSAAQDTEGECSIELPMDVTFLRMTTKIVSSGGSGGTTVLRINGADTAFSVDGDEGSVRGNLQAFKGDTVAIQHSGGSGSGYLFVGLVFAPAERNHFIYCGGNGNHPTFPQNPFWRKQPAFQWRDFSITDQFGSESNTESWQRSVVSSPGTIVLFRGTVYDTFAGSGDIVMRLVKGRGSSETVLATLNLSGFPVSDEVVLSEPIELGDLVSVHVQSSVGTYTPKFYYGLVVQHPSGYFMLGNGQDNIPSVNDSYFPVCEGEDADQTAADYQNIAPAAIEFRSLHTATQGNVNGGSVTLNLQINDAPGNLIASIISNAISSNLNGVDIARAGDELNFLFSSGGDSVAINDYFTYSMAARVIHG